MKIEQMTTAAALALAKTLPYAFITETSRVFFGPTPEAFAFQEWTEAHFFDKDRELRFLPEADGLAATLLTEEASDRFIDETASLLLPEGKQTARIRRYILADEDGQAYIAAVRFVAKEDDE